MTTHPELISLAAIEARADAATPGDWDVYEHSRINFIGNEQVERRIGTAHEHPQSHAPELIVSISHSLTPEGKSQATVYLERGNAEFIAHARRDVPQLLEIVRHLEAQNAELRAALEASQSECGQIKAQFAQQSQSL